MKKFFAMLLALAMVLSLAACDASEPAPAPESGVAAPETPTAGGSENRAINLSINAILATTDRHATVNIPDSYVLVQMNDGLVYYNDLTNEFEPRVAEKWEPSEDGMSWTFYLRKDAKFHNGDTVKASDVAFSIMRCKDSPVCSSKFGSIESCEALDDFTVKVNMVYPDSSWLVVTNQILSIYSEKEVTELGDKFGTDMHTAGCGPYVMTRNDGFDTYMELTAFPDYYLGEASIKVITFKPVTDTAAALIAFESGELDWLLAPIDSYESLAANDKYTVEIVPENHVTYMAFNFNNGELKDQNLRKAIGFAIDKETADLVAKNGTSLHADHLYNPNTNIAAPDHDTVYNYDPDKALEYLAKSSMPNGGKLSGTILTIGGSYFEKVAVCIQQNLADIGIEVEIETADLPSVGSRMRSGDFFMGVFGGGANGDYNGIKEWYHSSAKGASTAPIWDGDLVDNEWVDAQLDYGAGLTDVDARKAVYNEVDAYMMDLCIYLPLFRRANPYVWTSELNVPANHADFPHVYEWSWN